MIVAQTSHKTRSHSFRRFCRPKARQQELVSFPALGPERRTRLVPNRANASVVAPTGVEGTDGISDQSIAVERLGRQRFPPRLSRIETGLRLRQPVPQRGKAFPTQG